MVFISSCRTDLRTQISVQLKWATDNSFSSAPFRNRPREFLKDHSWLKINQPFDHLGLISIFNDQNQGFEFWSFSVFGGQKSKNLNLKPFLCIKHLRSIWNAALLGSISLQWGILGLPQTTFSSLFYRMACVCIVSAGRLSVEHIRNYYNSQAWRHHERRRPIIFEPQFEVGESVVCGTWSAILQYGGRWRW